MKVSSFVFVFAICVVSVYPGSATDVIPSRSHDISLIPGLADRGPMVYETFRMPLMFQRKVDKIDPANPVAAAATDPNEAAMRIKSRDLVPTDRPGIRPDLHRHRHSGNGRDDDDDDDADADNNGEDETDSKANARSKNSGSRKSKDENSDSDDSDDKEDSDSKSSKKHKGGADDKTKSKKNQNENEKNNKDKTKDKNKDKDNGKNTDKDSKSSKSGKKAHIGLDGKKVDDEDSEKSEAIRKNNLRVQHVKARQRKWRTGKPKYNYRQALAGWKEVGPMYYYKGKYANSANALHSIAPFIMAAVLSASSAFLAF
ncbi:hypothetical protein COEREDRAFT_86931 [Coemansia reversa NRRL 1564]|uniref:Uncharacterized protein n=1 Tax=Coemansia reversa (strain ATCC 12441 / NRRL 1564) TaxID=763665 RepID=A0A2G5BBZ7_COERN|nr:hypothetical protein COEREDRAFT_86931 [Coemansia reversa NRRL 1564]|eukprot:PIA16539.1 hypothetical protein COEREDRAFT_86931 [Coemansia reversa NRRL 1564]